MLKNYIKIAWRNLVRNRSYSLINLLGLTVGMTCCILIALFVWQELSYDEFHKKADRIIVVRAESSNSQRPINTPYPLAKALVSEMPEIEKSTRFKWKPDLLLSSDDENYIQIKQGGYTEASFFDIFSFELTRSSQKNVLSSPNTIVLTESTASQLFADNDVIGKSISWKQQDTTLSLEVAGIVEDPPKNSSIQFGALVSLNTRKAYLRDPAAWNSFSYQTFALLQSPEAFDKLARGLEVIANNNYDKSSRSFIATPFTSYHLDRASGMKLILSFFSVIALIILFIACINYVNLATARATQRAKEVGVRKTMGADRVQVARQFLAESVILCLSSFLLALSLSNLLLPYFNQLFDTSLVFWTYGWFLTGMAGVAILVGILAGSYPAFYLSGFAPVSVIRNRLTINSSKGWLRKGLVVTQFAIASVFILCSVVIYQQLSFVQNKNLGFNGDQVVVVDLPNQQTWESRSTLRNQIAAIPEVKQVSVTSAAPGSFNIGWGSKTKELSPQAKVDEDKSLSFKPAVVDYNFIETLDIELISGRNFSRDHISDQEGAVILNQKAVEELGWTPQEALGKSFSLAGVTGEIIGVVQNFHIEDLRNAIQPVVMHLKESKYWSTKGMLLAKLKSSGISSAMTSIETKMAEFAPNVPLEYQFLDEKIDAMYRADQRIAAIFGLFTTIALVIACMGLLGLSIFSINSRVKEIGIRKVLGATVSSIVTLLNKDFLKLVSLGFLIAVPIAWFGTSMWLQSFAYRIDIGIEVFLLSAGISLLIALATVSWQSIRAALANPVDSLRSE